VSLQPSKVESFAGEGGREELEDGREGCVPVPEEGFGVLDRVVLSAVAAVAAAAAAAVATFHLSVLTVALRSLLLFLPFLTDPE